MLVTPDIDVLQKVRNEKMHYANFRGNNPVASTTYLVFLQKIDGKRLKTCGSSF